MHVNLERALATLPEQLREIVAHQLQQYFAVAERQPIADELVQPLVRLLACSEYGSKVFQRESDWLFAQRSMLQKAPDLVELAASTRRIGASGEPIENVKADIRRLRHRYFLQVLWREFAGLASLDETLHALSALAEHLLQACAQYAENTMQRRFGQVLDEHGENVSIIILGMGKLGGRELNFSSDIDLIFLYPGGTDSNGPTVLSAQEYFTRVSRMIIALLEEPTADGFAFRVDTRLRPFGESGAPVCSFAALESYLERHGRGWERYAYVKARVVVPGVPSGAVDELYNKLITPFVYRRYLDFGIFESLREMHALIAAEVRRRDLADDIKLGPGGIREIEFIVQALQLVRGGSRPELQGRELQTILPRLTGRHGLDSDEAVALQAAYSFLRRLENFIQAMRDQQTHALPRDALDQLRLATAMRCKDWQQLRADIDTHRGNVAQQFAKIAFREQQPLADSRSHAHFAELWSNAAGVDEWAQALHTEGFSAPQSMAATISHFKKLAAHADAASGRRLQQFMPKLLQLIRKATQPDVALQRVLSIAEQVLRRSAYLSLLIENTAALEKLVDLSARSTFVAREIARYPVLLDELLDPRIYAENITRDSLQEELHLQLQSAQLGDSEAQVELLGKFQRATQFRIALADFDGSLPIMRVSDSLTWLAEVVLEFALQIAWLDLTASHGTPGSAGFGVIAYGKLGGLELSYGSDLDLVFLHDAAGAGHMTNGAKPLDHTVFYTRLVRRLVHFLTTQTGSGMLYEVDTRLRPDGRSGVLVTSLEAFERYQEEHAWTWEHQALLRARPVAGSADIAQRFTAIRAATLRSGLHRETLRSDVISMRARMRQQLDKSDAVIFDLKQGQGGIGDIEFLVQYLVLHNAQRSPEVIRYSDNIRQLDALAASGFLDAETAAQLQDVYRDYRLRVHRLLLDEQAPQVPQAEFIEQRRFVDAVWARYLGD